MCNNKKLAVKLLQGNNYGTGTHRISKRATSIRLSKKSSFILWVHLQLFLKFNYKKVL